MKKIFNSLEEALAAIKAGEILPHDRGGENEVYALFFRPGISKNEFAAIYRRKFLGWTHYGWAIVSGGLVATGRALDETINRFIECAEKEVQDLRNKKEYLDRKREELSKHIGAIADEKLVANLNSCDDFNIPNVKVGDIITFDLALKIEGINQCLSGWGINMPTR